MPVPSIIARTKSRHNPAHMRERKRVDRFKLDEKEEHANVKCFIVFVTHGGHITFMPYISIYAYDYKVCKHIMVYCKIRTHTIPSLVKISAEITIE